MASPDYTLVTLEDVSNNREIVKVTARTAASDTMTIVRAQEGTTARAWASGDVFELRLTAGVVADSIAHATNATAAHAASAISYLGSTNLSSTNVEAALDELDAKKAPSTGTAAGLTAGNVTTNANLTGGVTSVGNAATVITNANLTGMVTSVGNAASLGSFSSLNLLNALTDETGTGANVFATSPTLTTPALGTPTSGNLTNCTGITNKIQPITATVATSALTLTLNATTLDFRATTLGSGTVTTVSNAANVSTVISSGSTAGATSAVLSRIVVLAINNAGTIELAWVNQAGGTNLDETGVITTTAEGGAGAADSATVIYSTTARTGVAYRVVGYVDSTQATAGTWATAPSLIQGAGGQSAVSLFGIGYGQAWQNVTGSRLTGTTYFNTTNKQIIVISSISSSSAVNFSFLLDGVSICLVSASSTFAAIVGSVTVPVGSSYSVTSSAGTPTINRWSEFR